MACGEVFRALDLRSELGKVFLEYSSKGHLVPDDFTLKLWHQQIKNMQVMGRFKPEIDHLVLDGIPRNINQAKLLDVHSQVIKVFHLQCPSRPKLVERLKRRALKDNRLDDANEEVIKQRLAVYDSESMPVLEFYGDRVINIDATIYPYKVLREILQHINTDAATEQPAS